MPYQNIKRIYKIAAVVILSLALLISAYFIYSAYQSKNGKTDSISHLFEGNNYVSDKKDETEAPREAAPSADQSYKLILSKIGVIAPIQIGIDGSNMEEYNKALENGVAQLQGSSLPGQTGNSFIFGHSSYYPDKPGNFKQVFAKINDMIQGDLIEVQSDKATYVYKITDKKIVEPDDLSVASQDTKLSRITLMACWPIGTTKQRIVVVGELVK